MNESEFHPAAWLELRAAAEFYEARVPGLGIRFLDAVGRTLDLAAGRPQVGRRVSADLRRRVIPGFPYSLIYEATPRRFVVMAVAHQRRRPGYWRRRTVGG